MTKPYIERNPGDFITAQDWNEMQTKIRDFLNTHSHNGEEDQGIKLVNEEKEEKEIEEIKEEVNQNASLDAKNLKIDKLATEVISNITPFYICGTGLNNNKNRQLSIGEKNIYDSKGRGLSLTVINKSDLNVVSTKNYDTYGKTDDSNALALALNGLNKDQIGTLTSNDAWEKSVTGELKKSFKRVGLYKALGTPKGSRRPYAAIFEASSSDKLNTANAVEALYSSDKNAPLAEIRGWFICGSFIATGTAPNALSNNLGTSPSLLVNEKGNVGIGTTTPKVRLHVNGRVRGKSFESTNMMVHRMYPEKPLVYQNLFEAVKANAIARLGNAQYDDEMHKTKLWHDRHLILFGGNNDEDDNGAEVNVPEGYDTVWLRVLGDRWNAIKAYFRDGKKEQLGIWTGGYRSGNCYCPDGSLADSHRDHQQWLPIPVGRSGKVALISKASTSKKMWFSGVAFSKNPWAHATQSAVSYHWAVNGGNKTKWSENWEKWNSDVLTKIEPKTNTELRVPFVSSGRDKLLYLVEHNNNWNGCMHNGITVNGKEIERFLSTYDNPFARHWNSKYFNRYIAARIPSEIVPKTSGFLKVKIDMKKQNHGIHFREAGTHDLYV